MLWKTLMETSADCLATRPRSRASMMLFVTKVTVWGLKVGHVGATLRVMLRKISSADPLGCSLT